MDESLLIKYFNNQLTQDEIREVENWIKSSAVNKEMASEIYHLCLASDALQVTDSEIALKNVKERMKRPAIKWLPILQRIAALLFIPTLCLSVYMLLSVDSVEEYVELRTTPGTITSITLSDSTKVWLNSDSYIKYPTKFKNNERKVILDGEAYFDVTKDDKKKFIVETNHNVNIEVLGTEFNVEAYTSNDFVATTLVEGRVKFGYEGSDQSEKSVLMTPGQKTIMNILSHEVNMFETNVEPDIAWKDGKIIFSNTPLEEGLKILSKRFNVQFILKNEELKKNSFTGTFVHQHLDKILETFKISSNINSQYIHQDQNKTENSEKIIIEIY